jgi:tol-pal system protein YbgF
MRLLHTPVLAVCAAGLLTACASGGGYGGRISSNNDALSPQERRLQTAESRLAELSRRVDSVNLTGMDQENQRLRDDSRAIRGELERLRYDFDQSQKRAREQYLDIDRRLQRFEGTAGAATQAPVAVVDGAAVTQPSGPTVSQGAAGAPPMVTISQGSGATPEEEGAYQAAFDFLKNGKYDDAVRGFRAVLEKWPNGRYAENALYWTGEAYYVKRDYRSAMTAFQTVLQRFPSGNRGPEALLKVGLTQIELKQDAEGRATLQRVIQSYPQTNAARLAQQRLDPPKGN